MKIAILAVVAASFLFVGASCVDGAEPTSPAVVTGAITTGDGGGDSLDESIEDVFDQCLAAVGQGPAASAYGQCVACCQHACEQSPPCANSCAKQECMALRGGKGPKAKPPVSKR